MIKISKAESKYLEGLGCKWHKELFKTYGHHTSYYAAEYNKVLKAIEKYRKACVIK